MSLLLGQFNVGPFARSYIPRPKDLYSTRFLQQTAALPRRLQAKDHSTGEGKSLKAVRESTYAGLLLRV